MNKRNLKNFDKALGKLELEDFQYALKSIQATEGGKNLVNLENLFSSFSKQDTDGEWNKYKGYSTQVIETYLKYNGLKDYGCWQTKSIIDIRTSFIAGEGLSLSAIKKKTMKWIDNFITKNKLKGSMLNRLVKGTEFTGKALLTLKYDEEKEFVRMIRVPYGNLQSNSGDIIKTGINYVIKLKRNFDFTDIKAVVEKDGSSEKSFLSENFVYIVTGGDDSALNDTNTKTGMVLTEIENYDKALKDLRRTNYVVNRITPDFECKDANEAKLTADSIKQTGWKIGKARVGTSKFSYKSPSTSAHQNTLTELQANAKAVSTITGVPVHWLGHVELMSNRSTAETLYEMIDNSTKQERVAIQEGIYEAIIKAMQIEIDTGFSTLTKIDYDFEVRLPLISFHQFRENIKALSVAYGDGAISIDDYMTFIPGIDPIKTKMVIEEEEKKRKDDFKTPLNNGDLSKELEENLNNPQDLNKNNEG